MAKSWTDQPDELTECPILCSFSLERKGDHHSVEVRHAGNSLVTTQPGFYLTFGNLFGSQTVYAPDGIAAFTVIRLAGISNKLPDGCKVMNKHDSK